MPGNGDFPQPAAVARRNLNSLSNDQSRTDEDSFGFLSGMSQFDVVSSETPPTSDIGRENRHEVCILWLKSDESCGIIRLLSNIAHFEKMNFGELICHTLQQRTDTTT